MRQALCWAAGNRAQPRRRHNLSGDSPNPLGTSQQAALGPSRPPARGARPCMRMDAIAYTDRLVSEYLLFRGFTGAFQAFRTERAADRGGGFQAEAISTLVFGRLIPALDARGLVDLLTFLRVHVFSKLDSDLEGDAARLELSVLRLFIVHAIEAGRAEDVRDFYAAFGEQLASGLDAAEWEAWFALPFLQKPQKHPRFQVYFTKPWRQLAEATFRNCMAMAMLQLPLPALLRFRTDWAERQRLRRKVEALQAQLAGAGRGEVEQPLPSSASQGGDSAAGMDPCWSLDDLQDAPRSPTPPPAGLRAHGSGEQAGAAAGGAPSRSQGAPLVATEPQEAAEAVPRQVAAAGSPAICVDVPLLSDISDSDMEGVRLVPRPPSPAPSEAEAEAEEEGAAQPSPAASLREGSMEAAFRATGEDAARPGGSGGSLEVQAVRQELLGGHEAGIADVIIAPDGRNVASAASDGVVRIWAPASLDGNAARSAVLLCGAPVQRLAWDTRADKVMLVGTDGKGVKAWHLDTKRMVAHMRPDPAFPCVADLDCSPTDPSFLCAAAAHGGAAGRLSLWNLRAFRKVHVFRGEANLRAVCFSPDGRTIAAGGGDGYVRLYDAGMAVSTATVSADEQSGAPCFVRFVGISGASMVSLSADGVLRGWDLAQLRAPVWAADVGAACAQPRAGEPPRFAAAASGGEAALTSRGPAGHVVDLQAGCTPRVAFAHRGAVPAVAWHPLRRAIVSGSVDRTLLVSHLAPRHERD